MNLHNLFCTVGEVLLYLLVCELEHLQAVCVGRLRGLSFREVVDNTAIRKGLLDILIGKEDDQVPVWIGLPPHSIREDDLFLPRGVDTLDLAIMTDYLFDNFLIFLSLLVVLIRELQGVVSVSYTHLTLPTICSV